MQGNYLNKTCNTYIEQTLNNVSNFRSETTLIKKDYQLF